METLTAFIRDRTAVADVSLDTGDTVARLYEKSVGGMLPATASDVRAALTFIRLRSEAAIEQEKKEKYTINLNFSDLRGAHFDHASLDGAQFVETILDGVFLTSAALKGANFQGASAVSTLFMGSKLERAIFFGADLLDASFAGANLQGTYFRGRRRKADAIVHGVDFSVAKGDEWTELPISSTRPAEWPPERPLNELAVVPNKV